MAMPELTVWSPNALAVLGARYLKRDARTGEPSETPERLFQRVANHVAAAELAWGADEAERRQWEETGWRRKPRLNQGLSGCS